MKVAVFRWDVRRRPPFFGFAETWVYTAKFETNTLNREKLAKILKRIDKKYRCKMYKFIFFTNRGRFVKIFRKKMFLIFQNFEETANIVLS